MSIGRISIGEAVKEVVNRAVIELQERWDTISDFTLGLLPLTTAAAWRTALGIREELSANRTYYVRTDGSDGNTGLVNSAGGAFLTLQKPINTLLTLDGGGFAAIIQVAAGTYAGGVLLTQPFVGFSSVSLIGDTVTPANVLISTTAAGVHCVAVKNGAALTIQGFELRTSGASSNGLDVSTGAVLNVPGNMIFGPNVSADMFVQSNGTANVTGAYSIAGAHLDHWRVTTGGVIEDFIKTITLTATPSFSEAFAWAETGGAIRCFANTFSGAATGKRFQIPGSPGFIFVNGVGPIYLPGNIAGTDVTGVGYS